MTKEKANIGEEHIADLTEVEQYFNLLFQYSKVAMNREISHTINNLLTASIIQQSMLLRALRSGDIEKAIQQAERIGIALKKMEGFAHELSTADQPHSEIGTVALKAVINETLHFIQYIPSFANCTISTDLTEHSDLYRIDVNSIRILISCFIKMAISFYSNPMISITSSRDTETDEYQILFKARGSADGEVEKGEVSIPNSRGSSLGEIPLERLKRILQTLNKNIELQIRTGEELKLTLTIFPTA